MFEDENGGNPTISCEILIAEFLDIQPNLKAVRTVITDIGPRVTKKKKENKNNNAGQAAGNIGENEIFLLFKMLIFFTRNSGT